MPRLDHRVTEAENGRTVKTVALHGLRLSRSMFSSLKYQNGITLDGRIVRTDQRVLTGQTLSAQWEEKDGVSLTPHEAALSVPYADGDLWIVDKPAPLPTLCSARQAGPTLENALYAYLGCPTGFVFRPVNRLDKGTSGLMAVARNAHIQQLMQRQLHTDAFIREYLAVCLGHLPQKEGSIDLPIGKTGSGPRRQVTETGRRAVTHYRVEEEGAETSLVRLRLETGRTHQIRVHLSFLGCPIVGDYLYGTPDGRLPGRFALHACRLSFLHPQTGARTETESPLPAELASLMESRTNEH